MRRFFWILPLLSCTSSSHPAYLGDCTNQPCGFYIPGHAGGVTPTDSGIDGTIQDTGANDTGTTNDTGIIDTGLIDTGLIDADDGGDAQD